MPIRPEHRFFYPIDWPSYPTRSASGGRGGMVEDGKEVPALRSLQEWRAVPEYRAAEGATVAMLSVDLPGRHQRVNISLNEGLLRRIDRAAQEGGETRSGFLSVAAKARLVKLGAR